MQKLNLPLKRLFGNSRVCKFVNDPILDGIVPIAKSTIAYAIPFSDKLPIKLLLSKQTTTNPVNDPILDGIEPI